jgi:hypothetical protein
MFLNERSMSIIYIPELLEALSGPQTVKGAEQACSAWQTTVPSASICLLLFNEDLLNIKCKGDLDCVRSSAGKISYIDIFSSSNLQKYWYFVPFTAYIRQNNPKSTLSWPPFYWTHELHHVIKIVTNFATACFQMKGRIPLIGLETRLGWRTDRKFLRNPNLNEITELFTFKF